jgi:uncharacterized membrane protein (UPF0127 family)
MLKYKTIIKQDQPIRLTICGHYFDCKLAITDDEIYKGLGGVTDLKDNEGMLFCYQKEQSWGAFEMRGMLLNELGILFFNKKGIIVGRDMMNLTDKYEYEPKYKYQYVLEINSNSYQKINEKITKAIEYDYYYNKTDCGINSEFKLKIYDDWEVRPTQQ